MVEDIRSDFLVDSSGGGDWFGSLVRLMDRRKFGEWGVCVLVFV